jgi:hypothetical protein
MFLVPTAKALCPEIILTKTTFLPEETFQVEINGDFQRTIVPSDIAIKRQSNNVRLPVDVFVVKISNSKFFAYFDIPSLEIDVSEDYKIEIGALCSEGFRVRNKIFTIKKPVWKYYHDFENEIKDLWQYFDVETHASALASFSHDNIMYEQGRQQFNLRNCPNNCNSFTNSLAAIATKENEFVSWLKNNMYGNVRDHAYSLLALSIVEEGINSSDIEWLETNAVEDEEKSILVYLKKEDYLSLVSRQSVNGYWSKSGSPDVKTTAIAVFALKNLGELNNTGKIIVESSIANAEQWLFEIFDGSTKKDRAFILYFVFSKENIEAIMTIWPGVVKVDSPNSFSLILQNKGENDIASVIQVMGTNLSSYIPEEGIKEIYFDVPLMTTPDARALFQQIKISYENSYGYNNNYNVPLIIFTQEGEENIGSIGTNETNISEEESQEIKEELNQTNKTTQQEQNLIENPLVFDKTEISEEIIVGQSITMTLKLKNELNQELKNIRVQKSSSLINVIEVEPAFITKMISGETKEIIITISPLKEGIFEGTLDASVKIDDVRYESSMSITINALSGTGIINITKTCSELGGKECEEDEICSISLTRASDTNRCCIPESNCKKETKGIPLLGIIISVVVLIALLAVLFILTRKKKKQMSEILEEAKQKYESKFQRGLPRPR